ncbi:MAG: hypothetical protein EOQ28_02970 [Mesorhizobium sp.]|uniref:hypothetical protein n=1 Tax=Mesorhizobium sp. TaxID=1871066 RepID=UPI000FE5C54E|nr:hypothetical protein [Mesorhizobium sp.]RWA76662.1 MAG: hypothetical protein EOQ28_02970 [Mesorhizobium sp.]RWC05078.1 MAG: hypothetical protein EOQ57_05700 [Mesorhizobium sp.]
MAGPRDLRRGAKPFERPADPTEIIGGKSHFIVQPFRGFVLSVHRRGQVAETILCRTEGELNRIRRRLSDEGLIGYARGAA